MESKRQASTENWRLQTKEHPCREDIFKFEHGLREPPLPVLLWYARLAKASVETLIDDNLKLPD